MAGSIVGGIAVTVFGVIWTGFAGAHGGGAFALFGVVFVVFGIVQSLIAFGKAAEFQRAEKRYHQKRQAVQSRLKS